MCQGCYSSWSFVNEQCPLDSLDLAELARAHQSRVWPCIPDEVWINELWTSNSRITPHKSSNPARWNLQRTKKCWKNQHQPCHASQLEHRDQDGEQQQQRGYFKSLQLSDVWESTMNWAACQRASFTKQIKLLTGRVCLSEDCTPTNCSGGAVINASHIRRSLISVPLIYQITFILLLKKATPEWKYCHGSKYIETKTQKDILLLNLVHTYSGIFCKRRFSSFFLKKIPST